MLSIRDCKDDELEFSRSTSSHVPPQPRRAHLSPAARHLQLPRARAAWRACRVKVGGTSASSVGGRCRLRNAAGCSDTPW